MADFYWIAGTGDWSDFTNHWRIGGTGGTTPANAPTSADNVFFVDGSAAGTFTVTVNTASNCNNFDASGITNSARKMTLAGSSALNVYGGWNNPTSTYYASTYSATISFLSTSTGNTITTNGITITTGGVTFNGIAGGWTLGGALTMGGQFTLTNGSLDLAGYTLTTLTASSSNANTRSIAFGSGGKIVVTVNGATAWAFNNATGFSYTGTSRVEFTYAGAVGTRTMRHANAGGGSVANSVNFYILGGSDAINFSAWAKTFDFTGYTGAVTLGSAASALINGDLIAGGAGFSFVAGAGPMTFNADTITQTITTGGNTIDQPVAFNTTNGGIAKLIDNMTVGSTRTVTLTGGTLDLNGNTLSINVLTNTGSTARSITFNGGTINLSGSGATVWNATGSNFTTSAGTNPGTISLTSASAKTFVGGGYTYAAKLNQGGAGTLTISGSNGFAGLSNTFQPATITMTAGTTTTFTAAVTLAGTSGNLITVASSSAGLRYTWTFPISPSISSLNYCSITDSIGYENSYWRAYQSDGNVNGGNNLGWIFAPIINCASNFVY